MSWVGIVLWILMHAGDLIGIIQTIIDLIHTLPKGQQMNARERVSAAIQQYKKDGGDKKALKDTLENVKQTCKSGVGCPSGIVGA